MGCIQTKEKRLIAVVGATGNQGGAVINALQNFSENYQLRVITRTPDSDKAKALAARGFEVVKADADDEATLVKAFEGCYEVFIMTNFWQDMDMAHEMEHMKNMREAALKANIKHVVVSSLEDARPSIVKADDKDSWPILNKEFDSYVPHFDSKGEMNQTFLDSSLPTTILYTSFFYDNFINYGMAPTRQSDDQPLGVTFPIGDGAIPMCSLNDIGNSVAEIFNNPDSTINTTQGVLSELNTGQDIADIFSDVYEVPVVFNAVPPSVYASFGFPGADDLANMFRFWTSFPLAVRDVSSTEKLLGRKTDKLKDWVLENKEKMSL